MHPQAPERRPLPPLSTSDTAAPAPTSSVAIPQYLVAYGHTICEPRSARVAGVELLARWRTAHGQVLPPQDFLPMIHGLGLSAPLDNRMVRTATHFARRAALSVDFVAVNVDAEHLISGALFDSVAAAISDSGIRAEQLMLEVTELTDHKLTDDSLRAWNRNVEQLRDSGVGVAIDDFGTGFSSMTRLLDAPIDVVKVDRSLIARIDDPRCRALLEGLVNYAQESRTRLIAEGIETSEQARRINDLGIEFAQGFLYSRPAPLQLLNLSMPVVSDPAEVVDVSAPPAASKTKQLAYPAA